MLQGDSYKCPTFLFDITRVAVGRFKNFLCQIIEETLPNCLPFEFFNCLDRCAYYELLKLEFRSDPCGDFRE